MILMKVVNDSLAHPSIHPSDWRHIQKQHSHITYVQNTPKKHIYDNTHRERTTSMSDIWYIYIIRGFWGGWGVGGVGVNSKKRGEMCVWSCMISNASYFFLGVFRCLWNITVSDELWFCSPSAGWDQLCPYAALGPHQNQSHHHQTSVPANVAVPANRNQCPARAEISSMWHSRTRNLPARICATMSGYRDARAPYSFMRICWLSPGASSAVVVWGNDVRASPDETTDIK